MSTNVSFSEKFPNHERDENHFSFSELCSDDEMVCETFQIVPLITENSRCSHEAEIDFLTKVYSDETIQIANFLSKNPENQHETKPSKLPFDFNEVYSLTNQLGFGGHGHVYSAIRKSDGVEFAVKVMLIDRIPLNRWTKDEDLGRIPLEVFVLKNVQHQSIIRFVDYFVKEPYIFVIQELFGNEWSCNEIDDENELNELEPRLNAISAPHPDIGFVPTLHRSMDLFDLLDVHTLTEKGACYIFSQVVNVVSYLNRNSIVHGDLKDENILIDKNMKIKLIDFGGAINFRDKDSVQDSQKPLTSFHRFTSKAKFCGTAIFAAPEITQPSFQNPNIDETQTLHSFLYDAEKAEVWTLGILLHTMLFRTLPFYEKQIRRRFELKIVVSEKKNICYSNGSLSEGVWLEHISKIFTVEAPPELFMSESNTGVTRNCSNTISFCNELSTHYPEYEREPMKMEDSNLESKLIVVSTPCQTPGYEGVVMVREMSVNAIKLLHRMLEIDPTKRPNIQEIYEHSWIKKYLKK
ncbi:hypothetical protein HK096_007094 [Nowakowskiella sp. JEL0078]|nr:hypothetical protein HK096_007094 [Nowakowskiella sp. JEL0078]